MATKPDEGKNPEKGISPAEGGRGLDQGGPRTDHEKRVHESQQAAQKNKDRAGSNAAQKQDLPPKYTLTPEEEAKRNKTLHCYRVGAVGEKGQSIRGVNMKEGQEVYLTPEEANGQMAGGVPLTKVDDVDRPQEGGG